jgi:uncharacterized membrane protein YgaE (UPF0421/DUF939 family)
MGRVYVGAVRRLCLAMVGGGNATLVYNVFLEPNISTVPDMGLRSAASHFFRRLRLKMEF